MTPGVEKYAREAAIFAEVALGPTLKAAAKRLGIPPSSVTDALDRLESRVFDGNRLIVRRGRQLELTRGGEAFLPIAQAMAAATVRFVDDATSLLEGARAIRVGLMQGAWTDVVRGAAEMLGQQVEIEAMATNPYWPVAPLLAGDHDFAILPARSDHDDQLRRVPVFSEPRRVSLSKSNALAERFRGQATLAEIDQHPWFGCPPDSDKTFTSMHRCDDVRGGAPPIIGPPYANPLDMARAIGEGAIVVGTMKSVTVVFNLDHFGVRDVEIAEVPPWQMDLVQLRNPLHQTGVDLEVFADAMRRFLEFDDDRTAIDSPLG